MKEPVDKEAWRTFWLKDATLDMQMAKKLLSLAAKKQTLWLSAFIDLGEGAAKLLV